MQRRVFLQWRGDLREQPLRSGDAAELRGQHSMYNGFVRPGHQRVHSRSQRRIVLQRIILRR